MNPGKNGMHALHPLGVPQLLICLDYYDGPMEGVVQFGDPDRVFLFRCSDVAETAAESEKRLYSFFVLPADALERMAAAIAPFIEPAWPMWFPVWKFPSPQIEDSVNQAVDEILKKRGPEACRIPLDFFDLFRVNKSHAT